MTENDESIIPLTRVESGRTATIISLQGGRKFLHSLAGMGIAVGRKIEVIKGGKRFLGGGPIMISMGGHTIGVCRGMASKIMVKELPCAES